LKLSRDFRGYTLMVVVVVWGIQSGRKAEYLKIVQWAMGGNPHN
jgi:hypothetical protein